MVKSLHQVFVQSAHVRTSTLYHTLPQYTRLLKQQGYEMNQQIVCKLKLLDCRLRCGLPPRWCRMQRSDHEGWQCSDFPGCLQAQSRCFQVFSTKCIHWKLSKMHKGASPFVCTHTHMQVHTQTHICIHTWTCIHVCAHTHTNTHTHTHTHTQKHTYTHTQRKRKNPTHTHTHLYTKQQQQQQHTHTHTHTHMQFVIHPSIQGYSLEQKHSPPPTDLFQFLWSTAGDQHPATTQKQNLLVSWWCCNLEIKPTSCCSQWNSESGLIKC